MDNKKELITITTPVLTLPFKAHLVQPDKDRAERFPNEVTLKTGETVNTNLRYRIVGEMSYDDPEVEEFLKSLEEYRTEAQEPDSDLLNIPLRKGQSLNKETKKYEDDENLLRLEVSKAAHLGKIPVMENGMRVGSAKEVLPRLTKFRVEMAVRKAAFNDKNTKKRMSGIYLEPIKIEILERPQFKSVPKSQFRPNK